MQVDMLLLPSAPGAAPTVADASQWGDQQLLAVDALNVPASHAGPPPHSVPSLLDCRQGAVVLLLSLFLNGMHIRACRTWHPEQARQQSVWMLWFCCCLSQGSC